LILDIYWRELIMNSERVRAILHEVRHKNRAINDHGQPNIRFNASRVADRTIDELIGIAKGVLADGLIVQDEAEFIVKWITANEHAADIWPINLILNRLSDMLLDNVLDNDEKEELLQLFTDFTGSGAMEKYENMATALPLTIPQPEIIFEGREFCFTGKFVFGTRTQCIETAKMKGGFFNPIPRNNTDYLVLGLIGSRDWIHSTHGRKIEEVMKMRECGHHIAIVSERHWVNYL